MKGTDLAKTSVFGVVGLLGAMAGAVVFEFLAPPLPKAPVTAPQSIEVCLLIDNSGSMDEKPSGTQTKLEQVKEAAKVFVDQNASRGEIAVVAFGTQASVVSPLSTDRDKLKNGIDSIAVDGGTAMDIGLRTATNQFSSKSNCARYIFLFTDGVPDSRPATVEAANQIKSRSPAIEIVAVGTGDADLDFLASISGKPSISATSGHFDVAFKEAGRVIYTPKAVASSVATTASPARLIIQSSAWVALIALGIGLALIGAQNRSLHRPLLSPSQAAIAIPGTLAAGVLAGALGQALFTFAEVGGEAVKAAPLLALAGRVLSWALLGGFLAWGMSFFIPNLKGLRALFGGALGGTAGALGFLGAAGLGDWLGRVVGAALLGFFVGLMVALIEVAFREAWLEIRYGAKEARNVSLGGEPISVGSNSNACTVFASNAPPIAFRYWLKDNAIYCEDVPSKRRTTVLPGDRKQIGNIVATVCVAGKVLTAEQPRGERRTARHEKGAFSLRLSTGKSVDLPNGATLSEADLPGLHSIPPGGAVAIVSPHPKDPNIQGLQNLSHLPWRVYLPNGDSIEVKPGKNVRLATGTRVNFGSIEGEIKS